MCCDLFTVFTVVADSDRVRCRLFHQGGLTVGTVTEVERDVKEILLQKQRQ